VHKVAPSSKEGQLYDILIYLIPHKDATLAPVTKVEYYFGKYWDDQLFLVTDRAHNFPIATSAYGPFVCTAELYFSDGTSCILSRYVDFEMGAFSNNTTQSAN
jgi:poly(A) polymerase Pap1